VTKVEGGELPGTNGHMRAEVSHDPALGWITIGWKGQVVGSGTLVRMTVKPRVAGELPVIFAGPIDSVNSPGATVVAVSTGSGRADR
jgi:hypothetical protein